MVPGLRTYTERRTPQGGFWYRQVYKSKDNTGRDETKALLTTLASNDDELGEAYVDSTDDNLRSRYFGLLLFVTTTATTTTTTMMMRMITERGELVTEKLWRGERAARTADEQAPPLLPVA